MSLSDDRNLSRLYLDEGEEVVVCGTMEEVEAEFEAAREEGRFAHLYAQVPGGLGSLAPWQLNQRSIAPSRVKQVGYQAYR